MKNYLHIGTLLLILIFISSISGCRKEEVVVEVPPEEEILDADGITVQNTLRMLQMDGSFDNILDRSSCTSVLLPVNAVVNNQQLTLTTVADFDLIEQVFKASEEDEDTLYLIFPITLVFPDYSLRQIVDSDEFLRITSECANGADEDIECIDFAYPIEVSTYNRTTQIAQVLEFAEDRALYLYLDQLSNEKIAGFRYPLILTQPTVSTVAVNDNSQLNDAIVSADDTCDEEDFVPTRDEEEINDLLVSGTWEIALFRDEVDQTADFAGHLLVFAENGTVVVEINEEEMAGSWEVSSDESDGTLTIELEFDTDEVPVRFLNDDWEVSTRTDTTVEMTAEGDNDTEKFLTIRKL